MELRIENDPIDITASSEPDPDWLYTDKQGHSHRWLGNALLTLIKVVDTPGDDEYPEQVHYECRTCHETVKARLRSPMWKQYKPGRTWYLIDDRQVSKEEYDQALIDLEKQSCQ